MNNESNPTDTGQSSSARENTDMAVLRTLMAADRSLMAWVRTGLSLISFGFTIYKFLQYAREKLIVTGNLAGSGSNPKFVGLFMIGIGVLCLVFGILENTTITRDLRQRHQFKHTGYSMYMAMTIMIFGLVLFLAVLLKAA